VSNIPAAGAQSRAARNHIDWFTRLASASGEGTGVERGLAWAGDGSRSLLFPELEAATAGEALDAFLESSRADAGVKTIGCWSLLPSQPIDLGARLLARGFEWGWQPHWMRLELGRWDDQIPDVPGLDIRVDDLRGPSARGIEARGEKRVAASRRMAAAGEAWHFGARKAGKLVGHVAVSLCEGDGSAGLYDCAVAPRMRRQGIGAALTAAACRIAQEQGCADVLLNATGMGEPVYRRLGFESVGFGQTWWLHEHRLRAPLSDIDIRFVEAVGCGAVGELSVVSSGRDLDAEQLCGLTPVEIAAHCQQPASAEWLVMHGARLDLVSCWDLGWKERMKDLAQHDEAGLNARHRGLGVTPLHRAVERGDEALVRLLIALGADPDVTDARFNSTAVEWARHNGRPDLAALLIAAAENGGSRGVLLEPGDGAFPTRAAPLS